MSDNIVYLDIDEGLKRMMNNMKLYVRLLGKFRAETKLDSLEAGIAEGNMEKAREAAHTLKGVAANLSLLELFKQTLELETQIKAGTVNPAQLQTVKTVFSETLREIDKVIEKNG